MSKGDKDSIEITEDKDVDEAGSEAEEADEYEVEQVVDVRLKHGKKEYRIKWKNYSEADNTWEPEEHLDCEDLIKKFEEKRKSKKEGGSISTSKETSKASVTSSAGKKRKSEAMEEVSKHSSKESSNINKKSKKADSETDSNVGGTSSSAGVMNSVTTGSATKLRAEGFGRGLQPDKIIGATDSSGELMFLMKWKDSNEADLVPAREANVKCPQVVIKFYEERLSWHTPEPSETGGGAVGASGAKA